MLLRNTCFAQEHAQATREVAEFVSSAASLHTAHRADMVRLVGNGAANETHESPNGTRYECVRYCKVWPSG